MATIAKATDLREQSGEELQNFIDERADQLLKLRFQHAIGQLENTQRLRQVKREIARAKTMIRERELSAE